MSGLGYLFVMQWKNRIKAIFKKPSSCISMIVMIALLVLVFWSGQMGAQERQFYRPIEELYGLCTLLYTVMFVMTTYNGLGKGASLFSMADINHVFSAPIHPRRVLFYGLIQQLGTSLMVGFFLLFQYSWMHQSYGISIGFLLLVLVGYAIAMFLGQLTAMTLYAYVSGHEKRRRIAKIILFLVCGLEAAWLLIQVLPDTSNWMATLTKAAGQWQVAIFPIGGWLGQMVRQLNQGNLMGLAWLALGALYVFGLAAYLGRAEADYYEDVIGATQRGYMVAAAQKEGKVQEALPDNIKVGKLGLNGGTGASVFYYKHKLETRRARRFLLDTTTLIFVAINLVFAYFIRDEGLVPVMVFATYMQLFSIGTGRWARELLMPHIYLAPDKPFKKLMWLLRESMEGYLLEAVFLFLPIGLVLHLGPAEIIGAIACRVSFSLLYIAGNMISERIFGGLTIKMLILILYMLLMLILMVPGIILAVVAVMGGITVISMDFTWLMIVFGCNVLISLIILFLTRNILTYAELNQK